MIDNSWLNAMKASLAAEVIDDEEEVCQDVVLALPELIDEVLLYRAVLRQLSEREPKSNAQLAELALEAVRQNRASIYLDILAHRVKLGSE